MDSRMATLHTALYMLLVIVIGRAAFWRVPEKDAVVAQFNKLVFSVLIPLMVFQNIYATDLKTAFEGGLLVYMLIVLLGVWLLLMVLAPRWIHDRRTCGAFIQGSLRSNSIVFGMPVVNGLFAGQDLGCPTILTAITTIVFNVIGVVTLEVYRGKRPDAGRIVQNISKNPVLLASAAAIVLAVAGVRLPSFLEKAISSLAGTASPMGLVLIGASLHLELRKNDGAMAASLLLRLVIIPAIGLTGAALLGWRRIELCTVLIVMSAPTSVSAYSMAQVMDSDGVFAANQVGLSSLLGAGTVFLWTMVLQAFQLL